MGFSILMLKKSFQTDSLFFPVILKVNHTCANANQVTLNFPFHSVFPFWNSMEWMWDSLPWILKTFSYDRNMLYLNVRQLFLLWPSIGRFGTTEFCRHRELCHQLCSVLLRTTATSPPQHVPVPLDHSWLIIQPDKNKGCSAHNCLQFRHVLYFPSPCIELTNNPSQCMGLNWNCSSQNCSVLCSYQPGVGRWDHISRNSRKTAVSKIFFIMVLFCFYYKLIHICSSQTELVIVK